MTCGRCPHRSAAAASSTVTSFNVRLAGSMVVSHNCFGIISPRPLKRCSWTAGEAGSPSTKLSHSSCNDVKQCQNKSRITPSDTIRGIGAKSELPRPVPVQTREGTSVREGGAVVFFVNRHCKSSIPRDSRRREERGRGEVFANQRYAGQSI